MPADRSQPAHARPHAPRVVGIHRSVIPVGMAGSHLERRLPGALYRKALSAKANPRSLSYMERLFLEQHPDGVFLDATEAARLDELRADDAVVLLYPDPIGMGFGGLERSVLRRTGRAPEVLNGRRRRFRLDRRVRAALVVRRALAWSMAPELVATVVVLVVSPILALADAARGHR